MSKVHVKGRSTEKAHELLARAEAAGFDRRVVKTTGTGYLVPAEILDDQVAESSTTQGGAEQVETSAGFDPSEHSVAQVKEYLAGADETERERVLAAEKNGKARTSLVGDNEEN